MSTIPKKLCPDCKTDRKRVNDAASSKKRYQADPVAGAAKRKFYRDLDPEAHNLYQKMWAAANPEKVRKYRGMIWPPGVTMDTLWAAQKGLCWCCKIDLATLPTDKWGVDHNHSTRIVQALLCDKCNSGAGMKKDNTLVMARNVILRMDAHPDFSWFPGNLARPAPVL